MHSNEKPFLEMNLSERLYIVNNIYIAYPRMRKILSAIDDCQRLSNLKDEPECLFLKGETGTGKTTIIKSYALSYPRYETQTGTVVPILSITIPSPATVKSVVTKLLWSLGDPAYEKGTTGNQTIRLIGLMKNGGVKLVFLDEFQHFIDRDSAKVLKTVSDWLKNLILDTKLPVVLIGLPEAEAVFHFNSQLSRRFASRHNLDPFSWKVDSGQEFRTFLHLVESQLPLNDKSNLACEDMAMRLYYASDGIIAYLMKLIRYGTNLALNTQKEKLDLNVLAVAFEQHVSSDKPRKKNPFLTDNFLGDVQDFCRNEDNLNNHLEAKSSRINKKQNSPKCSKILHK